MCPIVDETSDIVLWHLRQLLLEDTFQPCEYYSALPLAIVVDNPEFNLASALFYDSGFLWERNELLRRRGGILGSFARLLRSFGRACIDAPSGFALG